MQYFLNQHDLQIKILKAIRYRLRLVTKILITIFLFTGSFHNSLVNATDHESLETKLKAAYIYNFLRFIEWPSYNIGTSHICVYGINQNYKAAFQAMADLSEKNGKLNIKLFDISEELNHLKPCRIVFITQKAEFKTGAILGYLKNNISLTIGESPKFIQKGGMINFIRVMDKVKFEINDEAAKAVGLKIPSKVLRIAERVVSQKNE